MIQSPKETLHRRGSSVVRRRAGLPPVEPASAGLAGRRLSAVDLASSASHSPPASFPNRSSFRHQFNLDGREQGEHGRVRFGAVSWWCFGGHLLVSEPPNTTDPTRGADSILQ
uniref:Uncharacterized protein n=1 Tax=Triticum urartu TaxID=4572 RepID=A0A8R7URS1_TRIUA